jgi:hypothetical protein
MGRLVSHRGVPGGCSSRGDGGWSRLHRPQASRGSSPGVFCRVGRVAGRDRHLHRR